MKKLYSLFLTALLACGILAACGGQEENSAKDDREQETTQVSQEAFPVNIKDAAGKEVTIEGKPERIISLIPSNTEIVYEVGAGDQVVGVSESDNYPKDVKDKKKVAGMQLNVEEIIALDPDLVLAHETTAEMWKPGLQQLADHDVKVLTVPNAENYEEVYKTIDMIGKATGHQEEAGKTADEMKAKIEGIRSKAEAVEDQKKVYVEISPAPEIYAAGQDTFMDEMLKTINAQNAVEEKGWPKMNEEAIIKLNPGVIVVNYQTEDAASDLKSRNGWENIQAVKKGDIHKVNEDLVSRPGPRIAEGVEELAKAVYPEIFKK